MRFHGNVDDAGKLTFTGSTEWVRSRIKELRNMEVLVEIRKYVKTRTNKQNSYLHGVLIPCFREAMYQAGYDEVRDDVIAKGIIKDLFLKRQIVNKQTGEVFEYVQNTSDLTTEEMAILYEEVWKFTAENLDYVIPSPNSQASLNLQ